MKFVYVEKCRENFFPKKSLTVTNETLDLIHSDLCGPMQTITPSGNKYIMTLIDDFSKFTHVYLLREKSEATTKMKEFVASMVNQYGKKPKVIRSDRGGEYVNKEMQEFLRNEGIKIQYTAPYSPQQNGTAERKNRYLVEMTRCLLIDAQLDNQFWAEAVMTANYLQNRLPSRTLDETPYEKWFNKKPNLSHIVKFGADVYAMIPTEKRRKLDEKAIKLKFVGYDECTKGLRLLNVNTKKITISRDFKVVDDKNEKSNENKSESVEESEFEVQLSRTAEGIIPENKNVANDEVENVDINEVPDCDSEYNSAVSSESDEDFIGFPRRSERLINKDLPKYVYSVQQNQHELAQPEPQSLKEALSSHDCEKWKQAMKEEFDSILKNETWEVVDLPNGKKPIGCKWVFKVKKNVDGHVERFKARLVAQGYNQKFGIDYNEVFAPVARHTTFRTLLSVSAKRNFYVKHFDAKTAFLNGELQEEIFMKLPPGFETKFGNGKVCRLKKSIYGLKQAARAWHKTLHKVLIHMGFKQCSSDLCLYVLKNDGKSCYLLTYVDDLIIACENEGIIIQIGDKLMKNFEIVSLGDVRHYLGLNIERNKNGNFYVNQTRYIDEIVESVGLRDAKISKIPIDPGYYKNDSNKNEACDREQYQRIIGQMLYIAINSRPDIAAAVSILSQKSSNPNITDLNEVKRVLRYLKGSRMLKLQLSENCCDTESLIGYSDADWAECRRDRKSNSGYLFKFNNGTISWSCRKQPCVTLSSTEAEYVALCEASREAIWLRRLLEELGEVQRQSTIIFEDNQSCLKQLQTEKFNNRSKHVDTKFHFIKKLSNNDFTYMYCPTEEMVADLLTKPIQRLKIEKLRTMSGLVNSH